MRATTLIWIGIVLSLPSLPAGEAAVCHETHRVVFGGPGMMQLGGFSRTIDEVLTKDVEKAPNRTDFNVYFHPWGEIRDVTTQSGPGFTRIIREVIIPGPLYEDCCTCGDNANTAYQLKIYSKDQDPTRGDKFDKPILVTQGFDPKYRILGQQFNFDEFEKLLENVFDENDTDNLLRPENERVPTGDPGLLSTMYEEGYDIALLLWKNPLIDIRTNALVTLQALRWLKAYTVDREGAEPVIIGPSLGGLVTRFALQLAGSDFPASDIRARLFIAFDSPNRGAEVPMSLQAVASYFRDRSPDLRQRFANLTSPAARQLLLSSVLDQETGAHGQEITGYEDPNDPGNPTASAHAEFMGEINDPEFRRQMKNIVHRFRGTVAPIYTAALINGSGTGDQLGYPQGLVYASQFGSPRVLDVTLTLDLVLATARANEVVEVFFGDLGPLADGKDPLVYFFREPAFMENAPGGLRPTYRDIIQEVGKVSAWDEVDPRFTTRGSQGHHAFIPSLSGVGLPRENVAINNNTTWNSPIGTRCPPSGGSSCPFGTSMFDEYRAPVTNQPHVMVTRENKEWVRELIHTYGPVPPPPIVVICPEQPFILDPSLCEQMGDIVSLGN
jgi:hypothetical protein